MANNIEPLFIDDPLLTDDVLALAAGLIDEDILRDIQAHESEELAIPESMDRHLLIMARALDSDRKAAQLRKSYKICMRTAACFVICIIALFTQTL